MSTSWGRSTGSTWNRDGVILFASGLGGIYRVPAEGGSPVLVVSPQKDEQLASPSFLPDQQHQRDGSDERDSEFLLLNGSDESNDEFTLMVVRPIVRLQVAKDAFKVGQESVDCLITLLWLDLQALVQKGPESGRTFDSFLARRRQ